MKTTVLSLLCESLNSSKEGFVQVELAVLAEALRGNKDQKVRVSHDWLKGVVRELSDKSDATSSAEVDIPPDDKEVASPPGASVTPIGSRTRRSKQFHGDAPVARVAPVRQEGPSGLPKPLLTPASAALSRTRGKRKAQSDQKAKRVDDEAAKAPKSAPGKTQSRSGATQEQQVNEELIGRLLERMWQSASDVLLDVKAKRKVDGAKSARNFEQQLVKHSFDTLKERCPDRNHEHVRDTCLFAIAEAERRSMLAKDFKHEELQKLCSQSGISSKGLNKEEMVAALAKKWTEAAANEAVTVMPVAEDVGVTAPMFVLPTHEELTLFSTGNGLKLLGENIHDQIQKADRGR